MRLVWTQYDTCRVFFFCEVQPLRTCLGIPIPSEQSKVSFLLEILTEILKIWWSCRNIYKSVVTWQWKTSFYPSRLERGFVSAGIFLDETSHFCIREHQVVLSPHLLVSNSFFSAKKKQKTTPNWFKPWRFFSSPNIGGHQQPAFDFGSPSEDRIASRISLGHRHQRFRVAGFSGRGKPLDNLKNRRTKGSHFLPKNTVHPDGFSGRCVSNEVNVFIVCWRCDAVFSRKLVRFERNRIKTR